MRDLLIAAALTMAVLVLAGVALLVWVVRRNRRVVYDGRHRTGEYPTVAASASVPVGQTEMLPVVDGPLVRPYVDPDYRGGAR